MWIGGLAVIGRTFPAHNFGKVMSVLSVTVAVGTSAGPVLSGILLEKGGYWVAWSSAFAVLVVDATLRLLMIERKPEESRSQSASLPSFSRHRLLASTDFTQQPRTSNPRTPPPVPTPNAPPYSRARSPPTPGDTSNPPRSPAARTQPRHRPQNKPASNTTATSFGNRASPPR